MKGNISIGDFIHKVKDELVQAQNESAEPFYELHEVILEVSFALEAIGKGKMNLYVVELGGETKASQTHKVTLKLKPFGEPKISARENDQTSIGNKGGGGCSVVISEKFLPHYAPSKF